MKRPITVNDKKVGNFLKGLSKPDWIFLKTTMDLANALQNLIRVHDLSKEDFCKRMEIKPKKYNDYIKGNYNYSVRDIARLNSNSMDLDLEKRAKERAIKLVPEKSVLK